MRQYQLDNKSKQRHHKKKLQANISYKNRYENSQQCNSKLNLAIYKKDYTAWSSGTYPRNARVAMASSRGSSRPRGRTQVSRIVDKCFTIWATREVIKEYIQCLATSKSKALPEPLERTQPCKKVGVSPVRPFQNTIRFLICIILSHYVCNNLWWNNRKLL